MLKDIATIKLQGANFREATQLPLFFQNNKSVKATLLYGRNGSGKSTIAKAFRKIKGENEPVIQAVEVLDIQNTPTTLETEEQSHIFVFDEDFVSKYVHVQEDGLGSIVMFGEQAGLSEAIEVAIAELQTAEADRDQKRSVAEEYNNATNEKSPLYYLDKMRTVLQQDEGWAGRKRIIDGLRRNASVTNDTYKELIQLSPAKTRDELIVDFKEELENLKSAQSGAAMITIAIPGIPDSFSKFDIETGNKLLKKVIERPELSAREKYLLELVQNGKGEILRATAQEFENPALDHCPKCYQLLSEQYKKELIVGIQKVLSEEVKEHQRCLSSMQLSPFEMDLSAFQTLEHYQECIDSINALDQIIHNNNALFQKKFDNPYTPVNDELTSIAEGVESLTKLLQQLDTDRNNYNNTVADTRPIKDNLTKINNKIAYYDVIELSRQYNAKKSEKETADVTYEAAKQTFAEKQTNLNNLNARRDSIHIATDVINDGLKYIFFSENRMQIQVEDGMYKLLSNGHPVKPEDVSVGERNIIGLCYFFTRVLEGKNKATAYEEEHLLIIDDPVSSYDFENKIGILSFLKYQLGKFLYGNIETRALVMTHDLLTAINVEKMMEELMDECEKKINRQRDFVFAPYELYNCRLKRFVNKRNEYTELMRLVYEYGNGESEEQGAYIGNIMRQVMEAFSTFEFKKGIEAVSTDDIILSVIENEEERIHYKNLMYRIVLNEGSHRRDQVSNMLLDFFEIISDIEKWRTAKEILCFMYLLNKPHIRAHLGDRECESIETWCGEIRNQVHQ